MSADPGTAGDATMAEGSIVNHAAQKAIDVMGRALCFHRHAAKQS
jgi:hypothetical protein